MRIAVVVWDLTISGGTQRQALELALRLSAAHDVRVVAHAFNAQTCHPDLSSQLDVRAVRTVAKRSARPEGRMRDGWAYDAWGQFHQVNDEDYADVAALIPDDVDVVNAHDLHTERVCWHVQRERKRKRRPRLPVVWMSNDVPLVHQIRAGRPSQWQGLLGETLGFVQRRLHDVEVLRERRYLRAVDTTVVLDARNQRQSAERMGLDATVVRSGLDVTRFLPRFDKDNPVFTILGTGILFRQRRFEDLVAAIGLLTSQGRVVRLDIIGRQDQDPGYATELAALVERLGLHAVVTFHGAVPEAELLQMYRDADVFVFPNHEQTWGLAVFEAMACGTPVIVSTSAGAHEVLDDGENALLVPPKDPAAIAAALALLQDEPALRRRLATSARTFVETHITWDLYAARMLELFTEAVHRRRPDPSA